jgi:hypothetical protein
MAFQGSDNIAIQRGGTMYRVVGSDILDYILANLGSSQYQVADIAARNALTNMTIGDTVFVVDASADATVSTGWAIYRWMGAAYTKIAEEESLEITAGGANLSYTAAPTQGTVVSSSGDDAIIPAVDGTNAGLMLPEHRTKLNHLNVTAATDLDAIRGASHAAATLAGTTNTNPLTLSGQSIGFSISQLSAAP